MTVAALEDQAMASAPRQRLVDLFRAEWLKLRSVRSSWITLVAMFLLTVGLSVLICNAYAHHTEQLSVEDRARFDPALLSVSGIFLAQIAIGVLGVLTMTAESTTGMIRLSLAAVPRRIHLYSAKVVVFFCVSLAVSVVTTFCSFFVGQSVLSGHTITTLLGQTVSMNTTIGAQDSLRVVLGAAGYLSAIGLIGLALGALIRRTAGAVAALFALVLVLPLIVDALPSEWSTHISKYLPGQAGSALMQVRARVDLLSPTEGAIVLALYVVVTLGIGLAFFLKRDA